MSKITAGNSGNPSPLKPWPKGVSGNPLGRPSCARLRAALKPYEQETVDHLIRHMRGENAPVSMDAITKILAYLYGKPESVQLNDMTDAEILAFVMWRKGLEPQEEAQRQ